MLHSGLLARAAGGRDVERAGADAEVEGELRLRVWGEERAMEERRGLMMVRRRRGEGSGAERGEECLEVEALSLSKQRRLFQRGGGGGGGGDGRQRRV